MGKVYSPEMVAAGDLPVSGAHQAAGRFILDAISEGVYGTHSWNDWPRACSVMIYGSTALGTTTIRSDVDTLLVYNPLHADKTLDNARKVFRTAEDRFKTPVEVQAHPIGALSSNLEHSIDPAFAMHLKYVQANLDWSRNSPVSKLDLLYSDEELDYRLLTASLLFSAGKRKQFARAQLDYRGTADLDVLQRALELPNAIGRKILNLSMKNVESETGGISSNKPGTIEATSKIMHNINDGRLSDSDSDTEYYDILAEMDEWYDEILKHAIARKISVEQYDSWIQNAYLDAIKKAHRVSNFWAEVVMLRLDELEPQLGQAQHQVGMTNFPDYEY